MALATWWRGDALPALAPLTDFHVETSCDEPMIANVTGLGPEQVRQRLGRGHKPYLAYIAQASVAYGWLARQEAEIGELGLRFALPPKERSLWDFPTLPA